MFIDDIKAYHDSYLAWLKDKTCLKNIGDDIVEITTPHLDRHNDYLQFYVQKTKDGLMFNDGGYVLDDLEVSGVVFNTPSAPGYYSRCLMALGYRSKTAALSLVPMSIILRYAKITLSKPCLLWVICLPYPVAAWRISFLKMWKIGSMPMKCATYPM